jgi:hypothetical protein
MPDMLQGTSLEVTSEAELMAQDDDPFAMEIPTDSKPVTLALPPAQIFEADFTDLPEIDEIFIITKDGILMQHFSWKDTSIVDEDVLASMLTVISNFAKDSFGKKESSLKNLGFGDFNLLIMAGKYISVVLISPEEELKPLEKPIQHMISDIEFIHKDVIADWNGDQSTVDFLGESINRLVLGDY